MCVTLSRSSVDFDYNAYYFKQFLVVHNNSNLYIVFCIMYVYCWKNYSVDDPNDPATSSPIPLSRLNTLLVAALAVTCV